MNSSVQMRVSLDHRALALRERLRLRMDEVAGLLCETHGGPVESVTVHAGENGWFDATWVTCCENLEQQATRILKNRC
jgi:hypothetical protein